MRVENGRGGGVGDRDEEIRAERTQIHTMLVHFEDLHLCYNNSNCTGAVFYAEDQRDCCIGTNDGLSYNNGSSCHLCIGMMCSVCFTEKDDGCCICSSWVP